VNKADLRSGRIAQPSEAVARPDVARRPRVLGFLGVGGALVASGVSPVAVDAMAVV
jgi:hypothetical protein